MNPGATPERIDTSRADACTDSLDTSMKMDARVRSLEQALAMLARETA